MKTRRFNSGVCRPFSKRRPRHYSLPLRWRRLTLEPLEDRVLLAVLFVDDDATGTGTGESWDDAFVDIQAALDQAEIQNADTDPDNDITEMWIAAGIYSPMKQSVDGTPRTETFQLLDGVSLLGGFGGTEVSADERARDADGRFVNETILTGDLLGNDDPTDGLTYNDNAYTVVLSKP